MTDVVIKSVERLERKCGDCQLCCRLLPIRGLKQANERCKYQRFGKGCAVYHRPGFPPECGMWNCRWLVNDDTGDLSRPDRSHYVIDIMPDFITVRPNDGGEPSNIEVVQIWIDPKYPDAHRDPHLRAYLLRRGEEGTPRERLASGVMDVAMAKATHASRFLATHLAPALAAVLAGRR